MNRVLDTPTIPLGLSDRSKYLALIGYFVGATYLIPSSAAIERFSLAYFALVVPAWIYIFLNWKWLFKAYTLASLCLALFGAAAMIVALAQGNPSLAYNALFLSSICIVILNSRVYITPRELNFLFLLCLAGSVAVYWAGITDYGFLPGQAHVANCHEAMSFRVSLFRVLTESAILSLFVFVTNVFFAHGGSRTLRFLISVLALYFLLFSGIRTIVLALLAVLPILLYQGWKSLRPRMSLAVILIVLISVGFAGVLFLEGHDRRRGELRFLQNYLFRTATCDAVIFEAENKSNVENRMGSGTKEKVENKERIASVIGARAGAVRGMFGVRFDWLQRTINRSCSMSYQLELVSRSPWFGNRSTIPASEGELISVGCEPGALARYCEACTLPTYWLSKAGVAAVPLLLCFFVLLATAAYRRELFGLACLVAFGVISIGWGVSFVPYNFTLLLMMSAPAMSRYQSEMRRSGEEIGAPVRCGTAPARISRDHDLKGS